MYSLYDLWLICCWFQQTKKSSDQEEQEKTNNDDSDDDNEEEEEEEDDVRDLVSNKIITMQLCDMSDPTGCRTYNTIMLIKLLSHVNTE